jgi:uncharacterized protein DUF222
MNGAEGRRVSPYQRHVRRVTDSELVRILKRLAEQRASSHARSVEVMAELRRRPCMAADEAAVGTMGALSREDLLEAEVAACLVMTPYQARQEVVTAVALDERLFATMNLLRAGGIGWAQVQVIARHAVPLADHVFTRALAHGLSPREAGQAARAVTADLEAMVLAKAPALTRRRLERRVEKAVATLDPDYVEEQRRQAVKGRSVDPPATVSDEPDGRHMSGVFAHLPAAEAQAIWNTVNAYAEAMRSAGDERTLQELRADTLTHLILRGHPPTDLHIAGPTTTLPDAAAGEVDAEVATAPMDWTKAAGFDAYGLRANVEVVVSMDTLIGLNDDPGELKGHGPIPAHLARDIAFKAGGTWRRLVTDPLGHLTDYGHQRYTPPAPLKQYIRGRDRSCRTPWCDRPAGSCDIDHVQPYPAGATAAGNLQCKCRRCHRLKHEGGWRHDARPDGTIQMTSPTGAQYVSRPADLGPVPRPRPQRARARSDPPF